MNRVKGQAIVEAIIAISSVLIVAAILLPLLTKFIETRQASEQAARYVAWERTVWKQSGSNKLAVKSNSELQNEVHWRFLSNQDAALSSDDKLSSKTWSSDKNINPMLTTQQTHQFKPDNLIAGLENNSSSASNKNKSEQLFSITSKESKTPGFGSTIGSILSVLDFAGFKLNQKGLFGSEVSFKFANLNGIAPFEDIDLSVKDELFVLSDGWNASGRRDTQKKVQGLTPSSLLDVGFLNTVRDGIGWLPFAKEIRSSSLQFGRVDTEQVPEQRTCRQSGNRCLRKRK
ncbi:hypothetical protein [Aliikangiella sp. IMCC44632]